MKTAAPIVLLFLATLCWPLISQQRTVIPLSAIEGDPLWWQWKPEMALKGCVAGMISVDNQYNLYLCVPDRNYTLPGHHPYLWLRLKPDPAFLPQGYLP